MEVYIGIDWSEKWHDVCMMNQAGAQLALFRIEHSPSGFRQLDKAIKQLEVPLGQCRVAIESSYNLLVDFLWQQGYELYVIAPSVTKSNRGRFGSSGARNDASDAYVLADVLRTDRQRLSAWQPQTLLLQQLRARLSLVSDITTSIVRYNNRLRAMLVRCYPQVLGLFSDLTTQIGLRFLITYPTCYAAKKLTLAQFSAFCHKHHYPRPKQVAAKFSHLKRPLPQPDLVTVAAYEGQVPLLAKLLLHLVQDKAHLIRDIAELFAQHPDQPLFASLPGAGDLLAPSLLVKFGECRSRFPLAADVQALAGTCPVTISSGKKKKIVFRKACDRDFRRIAQQFAMASVSQSTWARAYWQEIRPRCHSDAHAYRCLANRWLAIIWKMWQSRQPYDEAYHIRQRARHRRVA
jgi:transposase